jgi:hypothetical protein
LVAISVIVSEALVLSYVLAPVLYPSERLDWLGSIAGQIGEIGKRHRFGAAATCSRSSARFKANGKRNHQETDGESGAYFCG